MDQLPVEILMKTFSYVPMHDEILLVNKLFHNIACNITDANDCLRMDVPFDEGSTSDDCVESPKRALLESIQKSKRQISKVRINGRNQFFQLRDEQFIVCVVEKFSSTIKFLHLAFVAVNESAFLTILSSTLNLEQLELNNFRYKIEGQLTKRRRGNDQINLNMNKLKSLKIVGPSESFIRVLNCFPVGVITNLQINCDWSTLVAVLNRNPNIWKLKLEYLEGDMGGTEIFDKLKLETLELNFLNVITSANLATIISKQSRLKYLTLCNGSAVDQQLLDAVAELVNLEVLTMNVGRISVEFFVQLWKMKNLREVSVKCTYVERTSTHTLAKLKNMTIKKLSLTCDSTFSADLIAALAQSVTQLKHFQSQFRNLRSVEQDAMMRHFNFVEVLQIPIINTPLREDGDYFNPNLKEFHIFYGGEISYFKPWLTKFITSYPNITKLLLSVFDHNIFFDIRKILDDFPKLETLTVRGLAESVINVDDLDYVYSHKNLKFLSIGWIRKNALTDQLLSKLRSIFGLVVYDGKFVNAAVDRHTMNCEREIER